MPVRTPSWDCERPGLWRHSLINSMLLKAYRREVPWLYPSQSSAACCSAPSTCVLTASCRACSEDVEQPSTADVERNILRIGVLPVVRRGPAAHRTDREAVREGWSAGQPGQPGQRGRGHQAAGHHARHHVGQRTSASSAPSPKAPNCSCRARPTRLVRTRWRWSQQPGLTSDDPGKKASPVIAVNSETDIGALTTRAVLDTAAVEEAEDPVQADAVRRDGDRAEVCPGRCCVP